MMMARPSAARAKPARMICAGRRFPARRPATSAAAEHGQRQRRQRQARLHRVVLQGHLEEERQGDHRTAEGDLLEQLPRDAGREVRRAEQVGVEQGDLLGALAAEQPPGQRAQRHGADGHEQQHELAALLPDQDAEHDTTHADDRQHRADDVDLARAGVRHVLDQPDLAEHDRDDDDLEGEADPPGQVGGHEATEQRADRGGDGGRGTDHGVGLLLRRAGEVAVHEGLHRRQQQRRPEPADDRPEDDDRGQALRQGHGQGPDGVGEQAEHVGPLAPDQVAHLAVDQDERGGDQGLEGDRRLDPAGRGVEVLDDGGDRHVHQRGVDHQHEHRHGEQHHQLAAALLGRCRPVVGCVAHLGGSPQRRSSALPNARRPCGAGHHPHGMTPSSHLRGSRRRRRGSRGCRSCSPACCCCASPPGSASSSSRGRGTSRRA